MLWDVALLVATERLGWPGKESGRWERAGIVQEAVTYPTSPDEPTVACHLQPAEDERAPMRVPLGDAGPGTGSGGLPRRT